MLLGKNINSIDNNDTNIEDNLNENLNNEIDLADDSNDKIINEESKTDEIITADDLINNCHAISFFLGMTIKEIDKILKDNFPKTHLDFSENFNYF